MIHKNASLTVSIASIHAADAILIWNTASHKDYSINERLIRYNMIPCTAEEIEGRVAIHNGQTVGFVLACAVANDPSTTLGWVSAIAVHPSAQRQGIGSKLLAWAERWLKEKGVTAVITCERGEGTVSGIRRETHWGQN